MPIFYWLEFRLLKSLLISKLVGLNRILNKAIKVTLEALIILLANIITTYLYKGKLLDCYNLIIIVILRKVNKKDHSLPRTY